MHKTSLHHLMSQARTKHEKNCSQLFLQLQSRNANEHILQAEAIRQIKIHRWKGLHYMDYSFKQLEFVINKEKFRKHIIKLTGKISNDLQTLSLSDIDEGFKKYMDFIGFISQIGPNIKNLLILTIDFTSYEHWMPIEGFDFIGEKLGSFLPNLRQLIFKFTGTRQVTDLELTKLSKIVRFLPELEKFSLTILESSLLSDQGFNSLTDYLGRYLRKLKHLSFYFSGCEGISDESLIALPKNLHQISPGFQSFTLDLSYCDQISDTGLEAITSLFSKDKMNINLQNMFLGFANCEDITNEQFEALGFAMQQYTPNLNHCILDFSSCSQITPEIRQVFSKSFENLPHFALL